MASVTRSNRRAEGPHPHHRHHRQLNHNHHQTLSRPPAGLFASGDAGSGARQKRTFESSERDIDSLKPKRTRIAVEILSRQHHPPVQAAGAGVKTGVPPPPVPRSTIIVPPTTLSPPLPPSRTGANFSPSKSNSTVNSIPTPRPPAVVAAPIAPAPAISAVQVPPPPTSQHQPATIVSGSKTDERDVDVTSHQTEAVNGIKAEAHKLPPNKKPVRDLGRKLRSQEATRFKSDLSAYFPDYDEVIGNDAKEKHLLNSDTPIVIVDSRPRRAGQDPLRTNARGMQQNDVPPGFAIRGYGDSLYSDVFNSQRIDFGFLETQQNNKNLEDPLPDSVFEHSHKKAERLERSIRNSEKGRAQHEKDQIIRLLEGLQGPDWLKIMGVSGVTETKKRSFKPARAHFVKGCQAILEKFRTWNLEEKRRKQEKEKALQAEQRATLAQQQQDIHACEIGEKPAEDDGAEQQDVTLDDRESAPVGGEVSEDVEEVATSQSDTSDASPAKQLRQEALARSQMAAASSKKVKGPTRLTPPKAPEPPRPFISFFSKKHERDNALNRTRRTGRKVFAWGHAIPDIESADFVLPEEYRDEELLKSRARKKRRDKRRNRNQA